MLQTIIVWILIAAAVIFFAKRLYDRITGRGNDCGCGCGKDCQCGCENCQIKR